MSTGAAQSRSSGSLIAETLGITGFAFLAVVWIIPTQSVGTGIGLAPSFFPIVCTGAVGMLVLLDGVIRISHAAPEPLYEAGWAALVRLGSVAVLGAVVLQFAGGTMCALVTVPAGMLVLGERRPLVILFTTGIVAFFLALVLR